MGRDLKFRVWDKVDRRFTEYVEYRDGMGAGRACVDMNGGLYAESPTGFEPTEEGRYEVMRYSGLKDCNGTEVHEGCILKLDTDNPRYFEVKFGVYEDAYGALEQEHLGFHTDKWGSLPDILNEGLTVVGNVHTEHTFNVE